MAGEISYQQLTAHEYIMGVFKRHRSPISLLQRFYGVGLGSSGTKRIWGRNFGYDYFDPTRSIATGRAPIQGPATISRKPAGHGMGVCYRSHEKLPIPLEDLSMSRALGNRVGTIDVNGQQAFALQANFIADRFSNAREFFLAHMFRGGVGVTMDGESMTLTTKGSGTFDIDSNIPATHLSQLDMGTGSNILSGAWQTASTDIEGELLDLEKAFEREAGMPLRHIWVNGSTFQYLLNNTSLQALAGTARRTFESLSTRELSGNERPDTGYDVVFHGIPQFRFHVYNGVLHTGSAEELGYPDSISNANSGLIIPNNYALFTPDPSPEWIQLAIGSEPVQERINTSPRQVYGFHAWTTPTIDPPALELKAVDNFMPFFPMPRAIAYGQVANV